MMKIQQEHQKLQAKQFLLLYLKMGFCNTNKNSLIVTTINPIWNSRPVHPGTKSFTICSLKSKENIIFAHNFILKQTQTKHLIALIFICVYFSL